MNKEEIIILNGKEYTLTLNRESFIRIDKICNINKSFEIINEKRNDFIEEIDDNYNPFEDDIDLDELIEKERSQEKELHNLIERSFFIWLYPNHKLNISQVKELLKPYFEDESKIKEVSEMFGKFLKESIEIKSNYEEERKNLLAQANK